jgi:hypothetical protein
MSAGLARLRCKRKRRHLSAEAWSLRRERHETEVREAYRRDGQIRRRSRHGSGGKDNEKRRTHCSMDRHWRHRRLPHKYLALQCGVIESSCLVVEALSALMFGSVQIAPLIVSVLLDHCKALGGVLSNLLKRPLSIDFS